MTVTFTNESTAGATYNWSFGDGGSSTLENPSHTYAAAGTYTVTVTVSNGCGSDFYSLVIEVSLSVEDIALAAAIEVYPNPTSDITVVSMNLTEFSDISLELVNTLGQTVWTALPGALLDGKVTIDMTTLSAGVYQLNVYTNKAMASKQIVLTK